MEPEDLTQKTELESPEEQGQAEAQYAETRQQELLQRQQQAQAESSKGQEHGILGQTAKAALEVAKTQVKRQVKKAVLKWIISTLVALIFNPYTWIVLLAILILALVYACANDVVQCVQIIGLDAVIEVVGSL